MDKNFVNLMDEKVQDNWIRYYATLERVRVELKRRDIPISEVKPPNGKEVKNYEQQTRVSTLPGL
jgi:hypothetical protein